MIEFNRSDVLRLIETLKLQSDQAMNAFGAAYEARASYREELSLKYTEEIILLQKFQNIIILMDENSFKSIKIGYKKTHSV